MFLKYNFKVLPSSLHIQVDLSSEEKSWVPQFLHLNEDIELKDLWFSVMVARRWEKILNLDEKNCGTRFILI